MNRTSIHAILKRIKFCITRRSDPLNLLSIAEVKKMVEKLGLQIQNIYHFGLVPVKVKSTRLPIRLIVRIERPASRRKIFTPLSSQFLPTRNSFRDCRWMV